MIGKRLAALLIAASTLLTVGGVTAAGTATAASSLTITKNTISSTGALGITASSPVTALAPPSGCSSGNICFWNGANYSDGPGELSNRNTNWTAFSHSSCPSGTWNDCASSLYNAGVSCDAVLWPTSGYRGDSVVSTLTMQRGTGAPTLTNLPLSGDHWNNRISSNSWGAPGGGTSSACGGPV